MLHSDYYTAYNSSSIISPDCGLLKLSSLIIGLIVKDLQLGLSSEVGCNYCVQPVTSSLIAIPSLETSE